MCPEILARMVAFVEIPWEATSALVSVVGLQENIATKVIEMSSRVEGWLKNCLVKRDLDVRKRPAGSCRFNKEVLNIIVLIIIYRRHHQL